MYRFTLMMFIAAGIIFTPAAVKAQSGESAVSYMEKVFTPLENSKRETWKYLKAVTRGKNARRVENKREKLLEELKQANNEVRKMGSYESDDSLRQAVLQYIDMSYTVLREDFDKILDMEDIAEQSYDAMEAYLLAKEKAGEKLYSSYEIAAEAQKRFALKHDITLLESDDRTSEKISRASETISYYNDIYLIFFKAYKSEAYVLDAMQRNDINAFEQHTGALLMDAQQGMAKLEEAEAFNGDQTLIAGAKRILKFYQLEAEKDFGTLTDYFIKKDNFEKVKEKFEALKKRDRTQQDIDQYNTAVNEYNEAAEKANKILESGNRKRERYLDGWNKTVKDFFDKHA